MTAGSGATLQTAVQEYRKGEFLISTDPGKLDVEPIQAFLTRGYFDTAGIAKETVARATMVRSKSALLASSAITPRSRISPTTTSWKHIEGGVWASG